MAGYHIYTESKIDRSTYTGDNVNLADTDSDTFYFGWYAEEGDDWSVLSAKVGKDSDPGYFTIKQVDDSFWKITVDREAIAEVGWANLQIDVNVRYGDGRIVTEQAWYGFGLETPPLWTRWVDWDQYHFVDSNGWFDPGQICYPGEEKSWVGVDSKGVAFCRLCRQ